MNGEGTYTISYGSPKSLYASFQYRIDDYVSEKFVQPFPDTSILSNFYTKVLKLSKVTLMDVLTWSGGAMITPCHCRHCLDLQLACKTCNANTWASLEDPWMRMTCPTKKALTSVDKRLWSRKARAELWPISSVLTSKQTNKILPFATSLF